MEDELGEQDALSVEEAAHLWIRDFSVALVTKEVEDLLLGLLDAPQRARLARRLEEIYPHLADEEGAERQLLVARQWRLRPTVAAGRAMANLFVLRGRLAREQDGWWCPEIVAPGRFGHAYDLIGLVGDRMDAMQVRLWSRVWLRNGEPVINGRRNWHKWLLPFVRLSRLALVGTDLSAAFLLGTDLSQADLRRAELVRANLRHADLSDADLRGADLVGADLRHSVVCGARFAGADLHGAQVEPADLRGADLDGARLDPELLRILGRLAAGTSESDADA